MLCLCNPLTATDLYWKCGRARPGSAPASS